MNNDGSTAQDELPESSGELIFPDNSARSEGKENGELSGGLPVESFAPHRRTSDSVTEW